MSSKPPAARHLFRFGFLVLHNTVWFSELLATATVAALLVCFMSITALILANAQGIRTRDRQIACLRAETIVLSHTIDAQQKEARVLAVLRQLVGSTISDPTLCRLATLVRRSSDQFGYDPLLLVAVIYCEGVFDTSALGRFKSGKTSGALGLMQLQYETAQEVAQQLQMPPVTRKDLFNPETNLVIGVAYLTKLISSFKSFKLGLIAYNLGPGVVWQTLSNREPLPMEYYQKVLGSYYRLKKIAARMDVH